MPSSLWISLPLSALFLSALAFGQADDCSAPTPITGLGLWPFDNTAMTDSGWCPGGVCSCNDSGFHQIHDIFYVWTAPSDGNFQFVTEDNERDWFLGSSARIQVSAGTDCSAVCLTTGSPLADTSTGPGGAGHWLFWNALIFDVQAGDEFLLRIATTDNPSLDDAFDGTPNGTLEIFAIDPAPANDDCSAPTPIAGVGTFPWDTTAPAITTSGFSGGSLCISQTCWYDQTYAEKDLFFTWAAPCDGTYRFKDTGGNAPQSIRMMVHEGADCSATCIGGYVVGCLINSVVHIDVHVVAGQELLIQVGGQGYPAGWTGASELTIEAVDTACSPSISCPQVFPNSAGDYVTLRNSHDYGSGLRLVADGGPPGRWGMFLASDATAGMQVVRSGLLCLSGDILRYSPRNAALANRPEFDSLGAFDDAGKFQHFGSPGLGAYPVPNDLPTQFDLAIAPGSTWAFQLWYRDETLNGSPTANLSDAAIVTFP